MRLQLDEQRSLIEKYVRGNIKFKDNEDLFEDFCNEAFQKSYIVFNSDSDIQKIENYVSKVVNTSILSVLKDSGRLKRTSGGYIKTRELSLDSVRHIEPVTVPVGRQYSDLPKEFSYDIDDPKALVEEKIVKKEVLQKIADTVCILHSENPDKCYLEIYSCRFLKEMKQKDIAKELNLSQSEVSKRLMVIVREIREKIGKAI